ncbi:MAG: MerR family transcriptional regulator, partial [Peptostreptococcaceae bacterium]
MEYTIKKLAVIAGISVRTLRYYDEINLLKPCKINSSGYRIYGEKEVELLQQILLYKSMGMSLLEIKSLIHDPSFDVCKALENHYDDLINKKNEIEKLITTVKKTILYKKGEIEMSNKEKFEGFKQGKIDENEAKYGSEIREKYGD